MCTTLTAWPQFLMKSHLRIYRSEFVSGSSEGDELPEGRTADGTKDTGAKQRDVDLIKAEAGLP